MKKSILFFLAFFLPSKIFSQNYDNIYEAKKLREQAKVLYSKMSEQERISQIFLVNPQGSKNFIPCEYAQDKTPVLPGGLILFSYNIAESKEELKNYIRSINEFYKDSKNLPPYICVDQEGGLVCRLSNVIEYLPSPQKIREENSLEEASKIYERQAKEFLQIGLHMNLAPVAESTFDENKDFLKSRSFGSVPETVSYSIAFINAFKKYNISTVAKHFPGNTNTDPHTGLPEISIKKEALVKNYIMPFKIILASKPDAVLMSHARTSAYDSKTPSCLSKFWCTEILKNDLGFSGLVISDDIFMDALNKNGFPPQKAAVSAIEAGVHIIMLSEKKFYDVAKFLLDYAKKNPQFEKKLIDAELKVIEYKIMRVLK